ncbi:MAG TPA: hypothetical protein DCS30_10020 [Rhizobiales bacterium]|nr:hypothetical protein [Hyphomicrobiales bacterium]
MREQIKWRNAGVFVLLASLSVIPAPGLAQDAPTDYVGENHVWVLNCNSHGYKLKSKYPLSWYDENYRYHEKRVTLYMGKTCDASTVSFGKGTWCWANGGFVADLVKRRIGFPRQELICDAQSLPMKCRC